MYIINIFSQIPTHCFSSTAKESSIQEPKGDDCDPVDDWRVFGLPASLAAYISITLTSCLRIVLVNIPGNPRVKISDPYPYPAIPVPEKDGSGFFRVRVTGLTGLTGPRSIYAIYDIHIYWCCTYI